MFFFSFHNVLISRYRLLTKANLHLSFKHPPRILNGEYLERAQENNGWTQINWSRLTVKWNDSKVFFNVWNVIIPQCFRSTFRNFFFVRNRIYFPSFLNKDGVLVNVISEFLCAFSFSFAFAYFKYHIRYSKIYSFLRMRKIRNQSIHCSNFLL